MIAAHDDLVMDEVMTPNPASIDINAPIEMARELMQRLGIRYLPVTANSLVESLVNEQDLERHYLDLRARDISKGLKLKDVCTRKVRTADVNDPLGKILKIMTHDHIDALILLREGKMAGIFTESDACRILAKHLGYNL